MAAIIKDWFSTKQKAQASILRDLLIEIFVQGEKGIVFKGGTALSFFYGTDRFSEDIDLSSDNLDSYTAIDEAIGKLERHYKYRILNDWESEIDTMKMFRRYKLLFGYGDIESISTQVDYSVGKCILEPEMVDLSNGYRAAKIRVMKPEELVGEKVRTIYARQKARDLYDLHYLTVALKSRISRNIISEKLEEDRSLGGMKYSFDSFSKRVEDLKPYWSDLNGLVHDFSSIDFQKVKEETLSVFRNV